MKRFRFQGDGGHFVKKVMKTPLNMTKTATFILSSLRQNLLDLAHSLGSCAQRGAVRLLFVL